MIVTFLLILIMTWLGAVGLPYIALAVAFFGIPLVFFAAEASGRRRR